MKKLFLSFFFLLCCFEILYAKVKNITGFGLVIGTPTGINFKHFVERKRNAVECDFSITSSKIYLTASYLWHDFKAFGKIEEGELPLFYGPTAGVLGDAVGIGGSFGVTYVFADYPFDIFIKILPVIVFEKNVNTTFIGSIGGRYFFR